MSQPRRRRRNRRRRSGGQPQQQQQRQEQQRQQAPRAPGGSGEAVRRRSRRRGKRRSGEARGGSPKSSEDLVRALPRERPENLLLEPDGTMLEGVIGDLQSEYGVPQYPQEYRITIKIADGDAKGEAPAPVETTPGPDVPRPPGAPVREKAPAAPLMSREGGDGPRRSRRRRRRRKRGGESSSSG